MFHFSVISFSLNMFTFYEHFQGLKARRAIMREIQSCIKERQAEALEGQVQREDALALILGAVDEQGNQKLTAKEVQDSSLEMLFAGHLPTSSAACSCLMMVGNNPQVANQANTIRVSDVGVMLAQRHRRCTNIITALAQSLVFPGTFVKFQCSLSFN